jgi:hypothetical protein
MGKRQILGRAGAYNTVKQRVDSREQQGIGVYFFSVKIPLKTVCIEGKIYREVKEVEKGREKRT